MSYSFSCFGCETYRFMCVSTEQKRISTEPIFSISLLWEKNIRSSGSSPKISKNSEQKTASISVFRSIFISTSCSGAKNGVFSYPQWWLTIVLRIDVNICSRSTLPRLLGFPETWNCPCRIFEENLIWLSSQVLTSLWIALAHPKEPITTDFKDPNIH